MLFHSGVVWQMCLWSSEHIISSLFRITERHEEAIEKKFGWIVKVATVQKESLEKVRNTWRFFSEPFFDPFYWIVVLVLSGKIDYAEQSQAIKETLQIDGKSSAKHRRDNN